MNNFNLEYKLKQFREEQHELFDAEGKRYTGTYLSHMTAELMLDIINDMEHEIELLETD